MALKDTYVHFSANVLQQLRVTSISYKRVSSNSCLRGMFVQLGNTSSIGGSSARSQSCIKSTRERIASNAGATPDRGPSSEISSARTEPFWSSIAVRTLVRYLPNTAIATAIDQGHRAWYCALDQSKVSFNIQVPRNHWGTISLESAYFLRQGAVPSCGARRIFPARSMHPNPYVLYWNLYCVDVFNDPDRNV